MTNFYENDLLVMNSRTPKRIPEEKVTHADGSVHWYKAIKIPLSENDQPKKISRTLGYNLNPLNYLS